MTQNKNENCVSTAKLLSIEPKSTLDKNATLMNLFGNIEEESSCRRDSNEDFLFSNEEAHSFPRQISDIRSASARLLSSTTEAAPLLSFPFSRVPLSYACRNLPCVEDISQNFVEINGLPVQLFDEAWSRSLSTSTCISSLWVSPQQWIQPISSYGMNAYPKVESSEDYSHLPPLLLLDEGKYSMGLFHEEEEGANNEDNILASPLGFSHSLPYCYRYRALLAKVTPKRNPRKNSKVYPFPLLEYSKSILTDHYKHLQKLLQVQQHIQKRIIKNKNVLYDEIEESMHIGEDTSRKIVDFELETDRRKNVSWKGYMIEKESASLQTAIEETHKKVRKVLQQVREKRMRTYTRRGKLTKKNFFSKKLNYTSFSDSSSAQLSFLSNSLAPTSSCGTSLALPSPNEKQCFDNFSLSDQQPHDRGSVLLLPLPTRGHPCYDSVQLEPDHRYQIVKFVGEHLCPAARKGWKLVFPDFHIVHSADTTAASACLSSTSGSTKNLQTPFSTLATTPSCVCTIQKNKEDFEENLRRSSSPSLSTLPIPTYIEGQAKTSSTDGWASSKAGKILAAALFQRENPGKVLDEEEEPSSSEHDDEERNSEVLVEEKEKRENCLSSCPSPTQCTAHSESYTHSGPPSPSHATQSEYSLYCSTAQNTDGCTFLQTDGVERSTFCSEYPPASQLSHSHQAQLCTAPPMKKKKTVRQIYAERCWNALFGNYSHT